MARRSASAAPHSSPGIRARKGVVVAPARYLSVKGVGCNGGGKAMQIYVVMRRNSWRSPEALAEAEGRARVVTDETMNGDLQAIRSYVIEEESGLLGMISIYQATGPEAIRMHAERAILLADEIIPVASTVVELPDPHPRREP
jgi:hypothetical protein